MASKELKASGNYVMQPRKQAAAANDACIEKSQVSQGSKDSKATVKRQSTVVIRDQATQAGDS